MIKKITHRLGWKILSIALASFLWLLVVNYEDPIVPQDFNNIPVEKINASVITQQNKVIEYKEGSTVNITVEGKRHIISKLTPSDIKAFADLSKMSLTGAIEIQFELPDGVEVKRRKPTAMTIALENVITVQKEVQYYFEGEPAESYEALDPIIKPNIVQITGSESVVNRVASVVITITISGAKKDVTLFATPQLLDSNKNEVKDVTVNVDRISAMVPIEKIKTIPVIISNAKDLPEGYVITQQTQSIESVTIRGQESIIDTIKNLTISDISLEGQTSETPVTLNLENYLVDGVVIKDNDTYININYSIEKVEEKIMIIQSQDISVKNIPEGLKFSYIDDADIELTFKGIQSNLDQLTLETLNPNIRLLGLLPGEQQVALFYTLPNGIELVSDPPVLNINLVKDETPTTTTTTTTTP